MSYVNNMGYVNNMSLVYMSYMSIVMNDLNCFKHKIFYS